MRETQEEIGVDLTALSALYLGKFPKSFFARLTGKGYQLYVNVHLFLVRDQPDFQPHANEVQDVKLVDFATFANFRGETFLFKKTPFYMYVPPKLPQFLQERIKAAREAVSHSAMPAISIGMREPLWGLTLYLVMYLLTLIDAAATDNRRIK